LYEGFGLPVLESHAQGTPVVMSNDPALVELSTNSDKIFELENLDSLNLALKYFSETKQKLDSTQILQAQSMTWANSAQKHIAAYLGLLK
jgi:glycosyltransferase involved in cell wall biosynthesis